MFSVVISEKGGGERRELFDVPEISVGRVQGNELTLPKGNVSKRHARIVFRDDRFVVTDLNSTNGTYVNRRRITQATIVREGDRIYIGDFILRIELLADAMPKLEAESGAEVHALTDPPVRPSHEPVSEGGRTAQGRLGNVTVVAAEPAAFWPSPEAPASRPQHVTPDPSPEPGRVGAMRDSVRALVELVASSVGPESLAGPVSDSLAERIEALLQQAQQGLTERERELGGERVILHARAELIGLGPLGELLSDPSVSGISVPRYDRVYLAKGGRFSPVGGFSSLRSFTWAATRLCALSGVKIGPSETHVERRFANGDRLCVLLGETTASGASLMLRRPRRLLVTLEDLVRRGTISRGIATFLEQCLEGGANLLVVGPREGGVDTLLAALAQASPEGPVAWACDLLHCPIEGALLVSPESNEPRAVLGTALRLPGARLFVELAYPEACREALEALTEGAASLVGVVYAPYLERGLARLAAQLNSESHLNAHSWLSSSFDVVLEVARLADDRQRVLRVAEISGHRDHQILTQDIFTFSVDRIAAGGAIEGTFSPTGVLPKIVDVLRARGVEPESAVFSRSRP